eukprot:GEMP01056660.1.p1 GENE.GEMP01056660.1~~GEMP01056660.1.p1  ORF type:complete len:200 (+),score=24.84 GEMP01056660.1:22-621(+)
MTPSSSGCSIRISRNPSWATVGSHTSEIPAEEDNSWRRTFKPVLSTILGSPPTPVPDYHVSKRHASFLNRIKSPAPSPVPSWREVIPPSTYFSPFNQHRNAIAAYPLTPPGRGSSQTPPVFAGNVAPSMANCVAPNITGLVRPYVMPLRPEQKWFVEDMVVFDNCHDEFTAGARGSNRPNSFCDLNSGFSCLCWGGIPC